MKAPKLAAASVRGHLARAGLTTLKRSWGSWEGDYTADDRHGSDGARVDVKTYSAAAHDRAINALFGAGYVVTSETRPDTESLRASAARGWFEICGTGGFCVRKPGAAHADAATSREVSP